MAQPASSMRQAVVRSAVRRKAWLIRDFAPKLEIDLGPEKDEEEGAS